MQRLMKRKWLSIVLVFTFLIGTIVGNLMWRVESLLQNITANKEAVYHTDRPLSVLILGSDKRGSYGGDLTDVMMLAVFNPKTKKVSLLSIPRDTRVVIPGEKYDRKINSVMKRGEELKAESLRKGEVPETDGISLLKKTIESIYGIPVQNYVMINFDGFRKTIDQLGGIEVNVEKRLVYHDPTDGTAIDLYPGLQKLNGDQALGYVRHRHDDRGVNYFSSDYDRNARQQTVIRAVLGKLKTFTGMSNVFSILNVIGENLKTDLSIQQMRGLFGDFSKMDPANLLSINQEGATWDATSARTLIPLATLDKGRAALQQAMEMDQKAIENYNNSPAGIGGKPAPTSAGGTPEMDMNEDDAIPVPVAPKPGGASNGQESDSSSQKPIGGGIIPGTGNNTNKNKPPSSQPPSQQKGKIGGLIPFGG